MTDIKWPEGSTHKINGVFTKWVDGVEYSYSKDYEWFECCYSLPLDKYKSNNNYVVIERPVDTVEINWDEQPSAEHVWLELGYGYGFGGFWAVKVGDEYVIGNIKIYEHSKDILSIHQAEPTDPPYMPKVGDSCLWFSDKAKVWTHTKVIAWHESGAWLSGEGVVSVDYSYEQFRPVRTEREQFIEQAEAMRESGDEYYDLLSRMHDSGARFK